ncbi:MAG: type II toxin-antitoxin system VapB family antitoxin [Sphingomonadaceae bacterium]|nr:type II toxin-antitoxin system VapB family antitoxin [Sphingomonadaceae bacterium]
MQLNIKNAHVRQMATRLAILTGKSVTQAVGDALQHELATIEREREVERRLGELKRILAELPPHSHPKRRTDAEADAWLYDENGLPH